nr:putative ribonuclease H-like domain-containing protein [Tanacetum cinerariifolium]
METSKQKAQKHWSRLLIDCRSDLDTMSLDDLYNHLKVYESEVQKKSKSNSQNMAFISLAKHSSGNEEVYTTSVSTASTNVSPTSANIGAASISQETACAYIASQSNGSQIKFKDINQIDKDDMKEMDIKWYMALLSMRADRLWKKTWKKITIQGSNVVGFDKSNVECFNFHKMGHFSRECRAPRSQDRGRRDNFRQSSKDHALFADEEVPTEFALMAKTSAESEVFDNSLCFKNCLVQVEGRLAEFKNQEIKFCKKIRGLELQVGFKNDRTESLTNELELLKNEKGGCKITGKGTIKTGKLEFENVYFVKDLKYNLFSVSQICDNKNNVLFTDTEFIVLGRNFKLSDDANVLLRTPRQHNMYSIDLSNIVPHKYLTCLVAKASVDECMLWHRRLGHLNFKTMNQLVRHNLVRGLPTKYFENDHTCTACLKGKQHKASCKSKLVNSVTNPLHTLHMDLFGPTSVSSISHKWYCLVVTDDFSRFTWTFFLKTKDETGGIIRKFITKIENLKDLKVKIIRCDNGREFRNKEMNDFYSQKGIKREFSNARTPQQSGTNSTNFSGIKDAASQEVKKDVSYLRYIAFPNWIHKVHLESSSSQPQDTYNSNEPESSRNFNPTATSTNPLADQLETLTVETPIPTVSSSVLTACLNVSLEPSSDTRLISKRVANQVETPSLDNILTLTNRFEDILRVITNSDESNGVEANVSNMETTITASPTPTLRIHKDHPKSQIIGLVDTLIQTRHKSKEVGEQSVIAIIHQKTDPALFQFFLFSCFLSQDPEFPAKVYKVEKAMYGLHQAPRACNMARLAFCDYHNMIATLEKYEHNQDFHQIVDFVEVSHIRYALTYNPTVYVSHIRQFWSTARIETTEEGTKILATVDGKLRIVSESLIRRNLKLNDEAGIRQFSYPWKYLIHTIMQCLSPKSIGFNEFSSNIVTALVCLATNRVYNFSKMIFDGRIVPLFDSMLAPQGEGSRTPTKQYTRRTKIAQSLVFPPVADEPASPLGGVSQEQYRDDAPIKGKRLDEGEEAAKRVSDDTEEMATILTSMDATSILTSGGVQVVSTAVEVTTVTVSIPTGSGVVSTASPIIPTTALIFTTTTESTPYTRRKGKEKMVESDTPKKKKLQEQIDVQVARELEEQMAREDQRMSKQIARDSKTLQRKPRSKKQKKDYYMAVIKGRADWKTKDFKGMSFEQIEAKFNTVWKQIEDFIPMGSKEEAKRLKRKGLRLKQKSAKKLKTSKEVPEEVKSSEEVPEEKRSYWKITRLGGSSASYQFFVDMLKHFNREDLNQLWGLVKETLSIRPATSDKEKELWVELKRMFEPDVQDYLRTHTQNLMHAPVEWKLYDTCGVHHVSTKDQDIFMLIEKEYPLRKGLAIVIICYKLQAENYSQMANDLIIKIHKIANRPRQQDD